MLKHKNFMVYKKQSVQYYVCFLNKNQVQKFIFGQKSINVGIIIILENVSLSQLCRMVGYLKLA